MIARTAAEVAQLHPELAIGAEVQTHPDWSRSETGQPRPFPVPGKVVRHVRNGYVRVREHAHGTECDYDPRDVVPIQQEAK